jgi:predicted acylesterase/phospholipase RssA
MNIFAMLSGLSIGAAAAWQLACGRAAAEMSRLRAQMEKQIRYWQEETERARADAAHLADRTAAWVAGCQQGREDVLSLTRTLGQHIADDGPSAR